MNYHVLNHKPLNNKLVVLVVDLDETLIFYKGEKKKKWFYGQSLSNVIVRPHLKEFLLGVKSRNYEIILFSLGSEEYVNHVLEWHLWHVRDLFKNVLCLEQAIFSLKKYGKYKHSKFIRNVVNSKDCKIIGIDDLAFENMDKEGYYKRYKIKPFKGKEKDFCLLKILDNINNDKKV